MVLRMSLLFDAAKTLRWYMLQALALGYHGAGVAALGVEPRRATKEASQPPIVIPTI